jgi:hypothetical protein
MTRFSRAVSTTAGERCVAFLIMWHTSELIIWRTSCDIGGENVRGMQIPAETLGFRRSSGSARAH